MSFGESENILMHQHAEKNNKSQPAAQGIDTVKHLVEHLASFMTPTTVIVCVGNDICGDDGVGPVIARKLDGTVPWVVFDTQTVPESFLMKIVNRKPESLVLIDALEFSDRAGDIELFESQDITGQGPSTHGPAPLAFLEILRMMHPCRVAVLGIQPKQGKFGSAITEPVMKAARMIVSAFHQLSLIGEVYIFNESGQGR